MMNLLGPFTETVPFGVGVWQDVGQSQFKAIVLNRLARSLLGSLYDVVVDPSVVSVFRSALLRHGEELRLDGVALSAPAAPSVLPRFLARVFALSEQHICVHMHTPDTPFVLTVTEEEEEKIPLSSPLSSSVSAAAQLVSQYAAAPSRESHLEQQLPPQSQQQQQQQQQRGSGVFLNEHSSSWAGRRVSGMSIDLGMLQMRDLPRGSWELRNVATPNAFDDLGVAIVQWTLQGKCCGANGLMLALVERKSEEMEALDVEACVHPDDVADLKKAFQWLEEAIDTRLALGARVSDRQGRYFPVVLSLCIPQRERLQESASVFAVVIDVNSVNLVGTLRVQMNNNNNNNSNNNNNENQ